MIAEKPVLLIDGNSLLYRAHFAFVKAPLTNSRGFETSALFGFVRMLLDLLDRNQPEFVAVAWDKSRVSFRTALYPEYKGTRKETPPALVGQFPVARRIVTSLGIASVEIDNFEADDILGTLAGKFSESGLSVMLVSGDRDILQLVDERVTAVITRKGISELETYTPERIASEYGLTPAKLVDVKGLAGDSSDNIPGVPGIGEKTAIKLIAQYGCVERLLDEVGSVKGAVGAKLAANRDQALLSKRLGTIRRDAPVPDEQGQYRRASPDASSLLAIFSDLELSQFLSRPEVAEARAEARGEDRPIRIVLTLDDLSSLSEHLLGFSRIVVHPRVGRSAGGESALVGLGLGGDSGPIWYVPLAHSYLGCPDLLPWNVVQPVLASILSTRAVEAHDVKQVESVLQRRGLVLPTLAFDTMLASYLLNPGKRSHSLVDLAAESLGLALPSVPAVDGTCDQIPVEPVSEVVGRETQTVWTLARLFEKRLEQAELASLFSDVELPLVRILGKMERTGFRVDTLFLGALSREMDGLMKGLESQIHGLCGESFNVNSPVQLSRILFEKLGCPVLKRTKSGYSTDADVLSSLEHDHKIEVARLVNQYRHLAKLKGTYVDALPRLVNSETGRVHTTFHQTVTATGRLSSSDPNLQNIPVRTELGMRIRRAFTAEPGWLLLSADYSQIELRILAHLAKSEFLKSAFAHGEDIHRRTAAKMFSVDEKDVGAELRNRAKTINFGILYGMSAFGLSREVGFSQEEARCFMEAYFAQFPEVQSYVTTQLVHAREHGYVTTLMGRRRFLPQIRSSNANERSFAERMAVNTPVQGSAADLIKIAMVAVDQRLKKDGFRARMLLQVHDELIFEVPQEESASLEAMVRPTMEHALLLDVPIEVRVGMGRTWAELK